MHIQDQVDGRLHYDHYGGRMYTQYKKLFDELVFRLGFEEDPEQIKILRNDLSQLARIQTDFRQFHMYQPEINKLREDKAQMEKTLSQLHVHIQRQQEIHKILKEKLLEAEKLKELKKRKDYSDKQLDLYKSTIQKIEDIDRKVDEIYKQLDEHNINIDRGYQIILEQKQKYLRQLKEEQQKLIKISNLSQKLERQHWLSESINMSKAIHQSLRMEPIKQQIVTTKTYNCHLAIVKQPNSKIVKLPPKAGYSDSKLGYWLCVIAILLLSLFIYIV